MKRNMVHMFLPHAFTALVDSVCIFNMLPVCCAAIIFKIFQNIAFSPSWACIIVLYHVFFLVCVCVCFCGALLWLRSCLALLPRLQIWLYDLAQKGESRVCTSTCVFSLLRASQSAHLENRGWIHHKIPMQDTGATSAWLQPIHML